MATLQDLQQALVKADAAGNSADAKVFADAIRQMQAVNPVNDIMSVGDLLAAGAGKAVADTGLGIRQLGGMAMDYLRPVPAGQPTRSDLLKQEVAESRRLDAPLMNTASGVIGNIAGNVASALLPGGMVVQGAKQLSKIPAAAQMAELLMAGGKGLMAPTTIPTALGVGAVQGAAQPALTSGERMGNVALGAGGSALVPGAIRGYQIGKSLIDPLTQSGQQQIIGRAINQAAGSPEDAARALQNLRAATAPFVGPTPENQAARQTMGEIVPGSVPTTGQAAGVPSIASLSRAAGSVDAQSQNALSERLAQQNAARYRQVEDIAGTTGARDFAAANRQVVGNELYGKARQIGIDPAALTPEAQQNIAAFQARVPDDVMNRARELAKINGVNMDNESSVQGLHWIKTAIDDKIASAARNGDTQLKNAYQGLQTDLLNGMDQLSPAYGEARRTFSTMSKPINEMDVAQEVLNKSSSALPRATDNPALNVPSIRPEAFARALSDQTAANVVRPGATLEGVMQPRNLQALQNVQEDLARANFAQTAGKEAGGSDTAQKLAFTNMMQQSGLPSWISPQLLMTGLGTGAGAMLGGPLGAGGGAAIGALSKAGARQVYQDANTEMSRKLAQALLDPQTAIQMMDAGMINPQTVQAINAVRRIGSATGAMTPALTNSLSTPELYLGQ